MTLKQKINDIKFPSRVPNSPYSIKQITPATPISMMMELKNWLKMSINRVAVHETYGISKVIWDLI